MCTHKRDLKSSGCLSTFKTKELKLQVWGRFDSSPCTVGSILIQRMSCLRQGNDHGRPQFTSHQLGSWNVTAWKCHASTYNGGLWLSRWMQAIHVVSFDHKAILVTELLQVIRWFLNALSVCGFQMARSSRDHGIGSYGIHVTLMKWVWENCGG